MMGNYNDFGSEQIIRCQCLELAIKGGFNRDLEYTILAANALYNFAATGELSMK